MASPTFDKSKHDIGIGGKGYMVPPDGRIMRQDSVAHISRAAQGEGRYDLFQNESFFAQGTFAGGAGQPRVSSSDAYLSGVCDSRWSGHLFPARKLIAAASTGGTTSFMFHRDTSVYGFASGGDIELFGSSTTYSGIGAVPRHQPVVDGNNYAFYVTTQNELAKFDGTTVTDITANLGTGVVPYVVANYHRYLWCLATRVYEATPTNVQYNTFTGTTTAMGFNFKQRPVSGNLLVMTITCFSTSVPEGVPDGWILAASEVSQTANSLHQYLYYKAAEPNEKRGGQIRFITDGSFFASTRAVITVSEWEGMDPNAILDVTATAGGSATTTLSGGSATTTEADALVLFLGSINNNTNSSIPTETNYTELFEVESATGDGVSLQYRVLTATGTETNSVTVTTGTVSGITVAFKGNTITSDVTQFSALYSADGGGEWALAFPDMGTGVENPTAAHAAGGSMWFTTPRGLYQLGVDDEEFIDGHVKLNIYLRGKIDTFSLPSSSSNVGLWLTDWNGALYYGVGQSIRSFPMGAQGNAEGRSVWPTEDWGTAGGNVAGVVAGEGGVYFGAGSILWCFNQRGFHPLATNSTSGIYDSLYWHDGKLYVESDPASYYDFGYPSLRPDIYSAAATNFETSYWVSSLIDCEKTDVYKHFAQFQTFAEFSATSGSGTITLDYISADSGAQPDKLGGGATSLSWTTIGTHSVTDGNVKTYTPTPIKAKAIYLRLSWTVGASGYAIPQSVVANGRAIMPPVKRFVAPIWLASDARDKVGALLYPSGTSDVWTALDELNDLRNGDDTFTLTLVEPDGGTSAYTVTAEQMQDSIIKSKKINRAVAGDSQFVALQLPGTTVTETRP